MTEQEHILHEIDASLDRYFDRSDGNGGFTPGKTRVQFAGPVFGSAEIKACVRSLVSGWFTAGKAVAEFERAISQYLGCCFCESVNSGSSALLLAFAALKSAEIENPLTDGDEVITGAVTHPADLNCLLLNDLTPVLVDVSVPEYNINVDLIEKAITKRTRAILAMHFLGNPCNMDALRDIAAKHKVYLIEDACDAYGSLYGDQHLGSFGDMGTLSFYTAHGITMGEGGAIVGQQPEHKDILRSLKAWGRMCTCDVCAVNMGGTCKKRFNTTAGELQGYDRRYLFSRVGYNLKILEMQAAFGLEQLRRFPGFIEKRQENFEAITGALRDFDKYLILPKATDRSKPVWFAVPLTVSPEAPFSRGDIIAWLEERRIETRPFFAGFPPAQPAYRDTGLRVHGSADNAKLANDRSFFIGCYPGITPEMREYVTQAFRSFFSNL